MKIIVPFNTRILYEGERVSENAIVHVDSELFLELRGGVQMEADHDLWRTYGRVNYFKKDENIDTNFKLNSQHGREIRVLIKCFHVYYYFGVQIGTTINEALQKFKEVYEMENNVPLLGTDYSLVYNTTRLYNDDQIYAEGVYEFASGSYKYFEFILYIFTIPFFNFRYKIKKIQQAITLLISS